MTRRTDWNPLSELTSIQRRMNELFETALARSNFDSQSGIDSWTPVCDAYASEGRLVFCLELPGLSQRQIELRVEGDELIVEGDRQMERERAGEHFHRIERSYGRFIRRFRLPSTVDRGAIEARFRAGVLRIVMPLREDARSGPVRVTIG